MDSSACSSTSSNRHRILEVKVKYAKLYTKKKAKRYVKVWIHPEAKITTNCRSNPIRNTVVWNEKFVFSVSDHFLGSKDSKSTITFELYQARKFFEDRLIGTAVCKVGLLFENQINKNVQHSIETNKPQKECKNDGAHYDESDDDTYYDSIENNFDMDGDDDDEDDDNDGSSNDSNDYEERKEKGSSAEMMKANRRVIVLGKGKGLKVKGEMDVEMEVWSRYISCVGDCKFQNWVMRYDEFMGLHGAAADDDESVRMKLSWNCIAHAKGNMSKCLKTE